jgi:Rrf2 family protein
MKLSKKGEYGIWAACHLAEHQGEGVIHIRQIAERESIPAKFLEGILLELKRAGIVKSRRGVEGGYALARSPESISLGEIVRVLDGPLAPIGSADALRGAIREDPRRAKLYGALMEVRDAAARILDGTSLSDLIGDGPGGD